MVFFWRSAFVSLGGEEGRSVAASFWLSGGPPGSGIPLEYDLRRIDARKTAIVGQPLSPEAAHFANVQDEASKLRHKSPLPSNRGVPIGSYNSSAMMGRLGRPHPCLAVRQLKG